MEIFQQHKNTFSKGLNTDLDPNIVDPEQYIDAANVTLVPSGKFLALQNIAGTTNVQSLGITNSNVMGVFSTRYTIGANQNIPCLTIFTATPGGNIDIWCYDPGNTAGVTLYKLYEIATPSDYFSVGQGIVDGVLYPEKGMDILYFTDNYFEPRKVRCNIQAPNIATNSPFLTDTNMSIARRRAIGSVQFVSTASGGALLTGTYQIAYQLINLNSTQTGAYNKYTRFSLLTTPIYVYANSSAGIVFGAVGTFAGIGMLSDRLININILPTDDELANYTHFRLAVIENVNPEGTQALTASVTEIQPISSYLVGSVITGYQLRNNYQNSSISLDEIVIDTEAINAVKTVNIKDNRLFLGNISFATNLYNNGTPSFVSGSILQQDAGGTGIDSFSSADFCTNYKGYFRDEVYRFAIAYFDKFGNFSSPSPLNMDSVVWNQFVGSISSSFTFRDMKFPDRSQKLGSNWFTPLNSNGTTRSLGLQLVGINNHPTWARGFIILRVPRKKNILFQTPLIPLCNVYGLGPLDNYPIIAQEGATPANVIYTSGTSTTNSTGLQATPPGPINVLYPMNLAWPKKRSIIKIVNDGGAGVNNTYKAGEAQLVNDPPLTHAQIFPPGNLYTQNHPYVFSSSHQIKTIDAAVITIGLQTTFGTNTYMATTWFNGSGDTSVSTSFTALTDGAYYYDSGHSGVKPALRNATNNFSSYAAFAQGSPGTTLNGKFIMTVDNLETKGVQFGWKPFIQKCAVGELAVINTSINDTNALTFAGGSPSAKVANPFTDFYDGTLSGGRINTLEIVNVIAGLNDSRYGSLSNLNNYIFTGTQYNFTTAELATVAAGGSLPKTVNVFGGDCFVSGFNFKVTDTLYSVVNQEKYLAVPAGLTSAQIVAKWGRSWLNAAGNSGLSLPVALRNASQYLSLILESEYNGSVHDFDTANINLSGGATGFQVFSISDESKNRSPLVYNYNYNLNKENDQKIFIPYDPLTPFLTNLKSRIYYTSEKVYNTSTDGFDTVPVLNFFDLPEAYGSLTKLAIESNNLYSIQQRGIAYLPIGQRVIETTDASNLQVKNGDVINTPFWVDIKRGSQHLRSVKETGTAIYMIDNENQAIYKLDDRKLTHISDKGLMSTARTILSNQFAENTYLTTYDILRNELWFSDIGGSFCYVWNENIGCWVSNYQFASNQLQGGVFLKNNLYLVGQGTDNNQDSIHTMYTGPAAYFMGTYLPPFVRFIVNPAPEFGKTFDDILVNSTDRIAGFGLTVEREAALGNQTSNVNFTISQREGNYRAKILRDTVGARLRGGKATYLCNWNSGVSFPNPVTLTSVTTQWRPSFKQF